MRQGSINSLREIRSLLKIGNSIENILYNFDPLEGTLFHLSSWRGAEKVEVSRLFVDVALIQGERCAFFDLKNSGEWKTSFKKNLIKEAECFQEFPELYFPSTISEFFQNIELAIYRGNKFIVIDYINILRFNSEQESRELSEKLKKIAKENSVTIVVFTNRKDKNKPKIYENFLESSDFTGMIFPDSIRGSGLDRRNLKIDVIKSPNSLEGQTLSLLENFSE